MSDPRPRPTSSRPRPEIGDDLPAATSSLVPHPSGDEVALRRPGTTTENARPARPRDEVTGRGHRTTFNPGTTWLITPRTHPAWAAVLDLLSDGTWHHTDTIAQAMRDTAGLAPRTIENHLRSAARRGWINRRGGKVRLRDRQTIEQALDLMDVSHGH